MMWANKKYYTNGEIRSVNPGFGAKNQIEIPLASDDEPTARPAWGSNSRPVAHCCCTGSLCAWGFG